MGSRLLKPCPFCGGQAKLEHLADGSMFIKCARCRVKTADYFNSRTLKETWNSRTKDPDHA